MEQIFINVLQFSPFLLLGILQYLNIVLFLRIQASRENRKYEGFFVERYKRKSILGIAEMLPLSILLKKTGFIQTPASSNEKSLYKRKFRIEILFWVVFLTVIIGAIAFAFVPVVGM